MPLSRRQTSRYERWSKYRSRDREQKTDLDQHSVRAGENGSRARGRHVGKPEFSTGHASGMGALARSDLPQLDLAWRNRLRLERRDLEVLRDLPRGAGIILASNHADETDFKACLELSRRCGRRFLFMMNREAFDEGRGIAGWWLQRLGLFPWSAAARTSRRNATPSRR